MSIIYDALQKTQQRREIKSITEIRPNRHYFLYSVLLMTVISLIFFITYKSLRSTKTPVTPPHAIHSLASATTTATSAPATPQLINKNYVAKKTPMLAKNDTIDSIVINGIFHSQNLKMVMINNKPFNEGEEVNGMKIVKIESDHVNLQEGTNIVALKVKS